MYRHERSLVKRLQGKPFALVGVDSDKDREKLQEAIQKLGITWRSFWDGSRQGPIDRRWNVHGWPTLYLLDQNGVIRHKYVDSPGEKVLDRVIDEMVREAEGHRGK